MESVISEWWSQLLKERKCCNTNKTVRIVRTYPQEVQENVRVCISDLIKETIIDVMDYKDFNKRIDLSAAINGCFDNFPYAADGVNIAFSEVIKFINTSIDECKNKFPLEYCVQIKKVKWLELMHYLSRILVLVLKLRRPLKNEEKDFHLPEITLNDKRIMVNLADKVSYFFQLKEVSMDTKCSLAMASVLIREILIEEKEKLAEYHKGFLATLPEKIVEKDYELNVYKFLLGNAILNTWSGILIDAASIGVYLKFFIQLCESYSSDTGIILNLSRTLLLLIKNECFNEFMNNVHGGEFDLINSLLSCVYMLMDHPIPCVRHSSKDFLKLLVSHEEFKLTMIASLPTMLTDKRSYFICVGALANAVGSDTLISENESLKENMFIALHDPALVTYVIDALHVMIVKDYLIEKNFSQWCERWIVSLLTNLGKVRSPVTSEIEKLLQSVISEYPAIIYFVISKWHRPKTDEELRYIMAALKVYNKLSAKYQNEICFRVTSRSYYVVQEVRWKGIISERLLRCCLSHNDDDLRLSGFALIVEGLKSTERYTEQDFGLIQYSLKYNLNNQQPATRQKFLSLMRKMLTRFADSWAVLEKFDLAKSYVDEIDRDRRSYVGFREWLIDFCFTNIYDNANFNRLHTILSVLLDYTAILKNIKLNYSMIDDYWRRILVPLRSSYEENKIMAVHLIKKLRILKSYKEVDTIKMLFKKGYDLSGRIEPPNVLTGAYLLQALLDYPVLDQAVRNYVRECSTYSVKQSIVISLSNKLEEQICHAEKNLIRAALNNPMYGTLFAIRLILQETYFSPTVSDTEENEYQIEIQQTWKEVIRKLIGLSFRMIKVVSCVVNNSSPEGYLPSDFQRDLDSFLPNYYVPIRVGEDEYLRETAARIQSLYLDDAEPMRTRDDVIGDSETLIRYYDSVFLSHGDCLTFPEQEAMVLKNMLLDCMQLISELEELEMPADQESLCLSCLKTIRTHLKSCVAICGGNGDGRGKPTAQMLLLCSWRSIKEACLFLGDLVSKLPPNIWTESDFLTEEMLVNIGLELRTLLCGIKHRGAFEHAYVGFTSLVTAFWKCPMKNLNELPQKWLEEILNEIRQPVELQKTKFCCSRRSAGLPFLVQAIICSELKCSNSAKIHTLDITMNNLLDAADIDSPRVECRIHALNILRALFKHALLGDYVAPYVCQGLMIAIQGSRSSVWGVRNSACLLFSALIIRIFGVTRDKDALSKKNRMTARHFFQRYPELHQFFLSEMALAFEIYIGDSHSMVTVQSPQPHLFLILLILGRLYPSPIEDKTGPDFSEFLPYINASCCNPTLKIRELGAKALLPLISSDTFIEALDIRFSAIKSGFSDNNYLHGTLFQMKTILLEMCDKKELFEEPIKERAEKWIKDTESILDLTEKPAPYLIKIAYVQTLHLLLKMNISLGEKIFLLLSEKEMVDYFDGKTKIEDDAPGRCAFLEFVNFIKLDAACHIFIRSGCSDYLIGAILSMLNNDIEEIETVGLVFLKYITSNFAEEEELNLITMNIQDLFYIRDEKKFQLIARKVVSDGAVIKEIIKSFVTLLRNAKNSNYLYKMTTKLKLSIFTACLLRGIISISQIINSNIPTQLSTPIMDLLARIMRRSSSEICVGAFISYGVFFFENLKNNNAIEPNVVSYFVKQLFNYSNAEADVKQRMAVCELFNKYYDCFIHNFFKTDNRAMTMWILPVRLLSDEDPRVRSRVMDMLYKYQQFCRENYRHRRLNWDFEDVYLSQLTKSPYRAQEVLLDCYISLLDREDLIHLFVPMVAFMLSAYINTINCEYNTKQNEDGIFEKGNPNPFCEDMTFGRLLCNKLKQFRIFVRTMFRRVLEPTHIANLKKFFPSLILPNFPQRLYDFCLEIVRIVIEGYPEKELEPVSFLPVYLADLMELCDM